MGEISLPKLLIVFALIILVFGTKKLGSLGSDLGSAIKGFKKAMDEPNTTADADFSLEKQNDEGKDVAKTNNNQV